VAPGNAGTAKEPGVKNIAIVADDIEALKNFAISGNIDLTIIGPEVPLVAGIVDEFQHASLGCFGPSRKASQLEGSKSFSKAFLKRHSIPTADYEHFTNLKEAIAYIKEKGAPIVVKADGLAAGKGVVVAQTETEAISAVTDMLAGNKFGEAGNSVIVEEYMLGEEASFIVICDGNCALPLASSQDHKARDESDKGPNTGGMGAYSPAPVVDTAMHQRIMREVIEPALQGMRDEDMPYVGFLYAGIMITKDGTPKVLEFNCRFGDPETQPVLMRLKSDLVDLCAAALKGELKNREIEWDDRAALGVVMASKGYPESATKGEVISGLKTNTDEDTKIFHAGTMEKNDEIVTAGGRVLCVTALGKNVCEAQKKAYSEVAKIQCDGMFFRKDIGYRAINREKTANN
jgi:phosphoribosylamine--glycine ligase